VPVGDAGALPDGDVDGVVAHVDRLLGRQVQAFEHREQVPGVRLRVGDGVAAEHDLDRVGEPHRAQHGVRQVGRLVRADADPHPGATQRGKRTGAVGEHGAQLRRSGRVPGPVVVVDRGDRLVVLRPTRIEAAKHREHEVDRAVPHRGCHLGGADPGQPDGLERAGQRRGDVVDRVDEGPVEIEDDAADLRERGRLCHAAPSAVRASS
jgi:hypothetical protein